MSCGSKTILCWLIGPREKWWLVSSTIAFVDLNTGTIVYVLESLLACTTYRLNWIALESSRVKVKFKLVWIWAICFWVELVRIWFGSGRHRVNKISGLFGFDLESFRVWVDIGSIRLLVNLDSIWVNRILDKIGSVQGFGSIRFGIRSISSFRSNLV